GKPIAFLQGAAARRRVRVIEAQVPDESRHTFPPFGLETCALPCQTHATRAVTLPTCHAGCQGCQGCQRCQRGVSAMSEPCRGTAGARPRISCWEGESGRPAEGPAAPGQENLRDEGELAADLAAGVLVRVDVDVGGPGLDGAQDRLEVAGLDSLG